MISSCCDGLKVLASVYDDGDDSEAKPWQENGWQVFVFTNIEESKWQFWEELMTWGKYRFRSSFRPIHVGHKPRLMASPTEGNICEDTAKHQKLTQRTEELKTNDLLEEGTGRSQDHRDSWLCRCQSWRLACSVHPGCSPVGQTIEAELEAL